LVGADDAARTMAGDGDRAGALAGVAAGVSVQQLLRAGVAVLERAVALSSTLPDVAVRVHAAAAAVSLGAPVRRVPAQDHAGRAPGRRDHTEVRTRHDAAAHADHARRARCDRSLVETRIHRAPLARDAERPRALEPDLLAARAVAPRRRDLEATQQALGDPSP